ncbi:hypothetical protein PG5_16400 [Pseudomonas sp. G5(2012)]|nr:hypothetical protein PG5_16400 [Pseudomonas sp. G5(2012)]
MAARRGSIFIKNPLQSVGLENLAADWSRAGRRVGVFTEC